MVRRLGFLGLFGDGEARATADGHAGLSTGVANGDVDQETRCAERDIEVGTTPTPVLDRVVAWRARLQPRRATQPGDPLRQQPDDGIMPPRDCRGAGAVAREAVPRVEQQVALALAAGPAS